MGSRPEDPERRMRNIRFYPLILLFAFLFSCAEGEVYYRFQHIDKGRWYRDSTMQFHMDSLTLLAGAKYDLSIEISTNGTYPYRDIWIQVTHNLTDTLPRNDTLHFRIADDYGRWLGYGVGGLNQLSQPFLFSLPLDTASGYVVKLRQVMDANPLPGIEKIGIKVTAQRKQ
ncbi:MAG: gliding motility lipoprotein GldH [Proteiniphilum sp.]|jgi:gliding motility-associated lipoprotein GldH|nr:gliding motility lipoprotein GldH [Proteiniphilum sp.]